MDVLTPSNVAIAINAFEQMDKRNASLNKHWEMNIQRCQYQADIAQRRFEQVDPANRLVAASLEKSWNKELEKLALANKEYQEYLTEQKNGPLQINKEEILKLASQIPTLWSKTKNMKDKKRIVRLLVNDITVTRDKDRKLLFLNLRWLAGPVQQFQVNLPLNIADKVRYPREIVDRVKELSLLYGNDQKTAESLNSSGTISATGKPFTTAMIRWIRFKHHIERPVIKSATEFTVSEVCNMFGISRYMAYYWVDRKSVQARKVGGHLLIEINQAKKLELREIIENSYKKDAMVNPPKGSN